MLLSVLAGSALVVAAEDRSSCSAMISQDTGQPLMFTRGSLTWGLSTKPAAYGQKLLVLLWIYNPTEEPLPVLTCSDIDHFWAREIEVVDAAGKSIVSLDAEKRRRDRDAGNFSPEVWSCARNVLFTVPPHTCLHGTFSKPEYDFARDLTKYYSLQPGQYSLMVLKNQTPAAGSRTSVAETSELHITVTKP
jgi:hypothetical protein